MMFSARVFSNALQVAAAFEKASREVPKAMEQVMNDVAEMTLAAAPQEIKRAGYGFPEADVRRALRIEPASAGRLVARVVASGRPMPLIKFDAQQTSTGVSVSVLNGRKTITGAFIARMPGGHEGVFVRERAAGGKSRVRELYGPSVANGLANPAVQQALQMNVAKHLPKLMEAQIVKPSARR